MPLYLRASISIERWSFRFGWFSFYTMERQSIGRALFRGQGGFFVMTTQGEGTLGQCLWSYQKN